MFSLGNYNRQNPLILPPKAGLFNREGLMRYKLCSIVAQHVNRSCNDYRGLCLDRLDSSGYAEDLIYEMAGELGISVVKQHNDDILYRFGYNSSTYTEDQNQAARVIQNAWRQHTASNK